MKKIITVVLILGIVLLTGCSEKEGKLVCKKEQDINSNTKLESVYTVAYKNGYVTKLNTEEIITSEEESILNTYKDNLEKVYSAYNNIKYYENKIKIEGNRLISTTKVDYEHIDTDKLIEIDENNKVAIENGKVKVSVLKEAYEQLNATCKEEGK